jgi:dTDP-4-dehydrorhamnose reductase
LIIETLEKRTTGTFHLAGATRVSRYEFAQHLAEAFNLDPKYITPVQSKQIKWVAGRPRDSSLSVEKAEHELANKPLGIHEALKEMKKEIT